MTDLGTQLLAATIVGRHVRKRTIGTGYFDPVYPFHGAVRDCPYCGERYRIHGGFADHRDRCEEGPCPGANPMPVTD